MIAVLQATFAQLTRSPAGKWLARRPVANPENSNSAIEQFTYVGDVYDDALRAKLSLFTTMISDPLFDDLRTKQQLGYIVGCTRARAE